MQKVEKKTKLYRTCNSILRKLKTQLIFLNLFAFRKKHQRAIFLNTIHLASSPVPDEYVCNRINACGFTNGR